MHTWKDVIERCARGNPPPPARVERSPAQWRELLAPEVFRITREAGTERAFSSPLCSLFEPGRYGCACCGTPLFDAGTKFESHSGWPSFTAPLVDAAVAYRMDDSHGMRRVEITCNACDGHLGHVFPDGPPPSGLRFCVNALSLRKLDN